MADYESVRRRARPDPNTPGEQIGGQDRGLWYYRNLATHIVNYAQGAYEGFDGEADVTLDAVDLTTIHRAKGLEWPAVFVPSLTARRFPSSQTGQRQRLADSPGPLPGRPLRGQRRRRTPAVLCRADPGPGLAVGLPSCPHRQTGGRRQPLPGRAPPPRDRPGRHHPPRPRNRRRRDEPLALTYSELASYLTCGLAYRLRP